MSDFLLKLVIIAIIMMLLIPVSLIGASGGGYQPKKQIKKDPFALQELDR